MACIKWRSSRRGTHSEAKPGGLRGRLGQAWDGWAFSRSGCRQGNLVALEYAAFHYFGLAKKNYSITTRGGLKIDSTAVGIQAVIEVFGANVYGLPGDLGDAPQVIDVGAHIGSTALAIANTYPTARIVCLEPAPDTYEILSANVRKNGFANRVRTLKVALYNGVSGARLDTTAGRASPSRRLSLVSLEEPLKTVDVQTMSLEDVMKELPGPIDLLKIDCEGSEYNIILDSNDSIWDEVRRVVVEYHPVDGFDLSDLRQTMERRGFVETGHWRWRWSYSGLGMCWWAKEGFTLGHGPKTK